MFYFKEFLSLFLFIWKANLTFGQVLMVSDKHIPQISIYLPKLTLVFLNDSFY